jgi:Ferredoxin-like domain in Api92-like protein
MITRAKDAFARGELCQEFVPCPAELHEHNAPVRDAKLADRFVEQYGASDWYNWQVNNWGTKWDVGSGDGINSFTDNELVVYFDSAWAPPIALMEKLEEQEFTVDLMYNETGMAFCGRYSDGFDDYYEYGGMNSAEVAIEIPGDLDEAFCISENLAMWEQENAENCDE